MRVSFILPFLFVFLSFIIVSLCHEQSDITNGELLMWCLPALKNSNLCGVCVTNVTIIGEHL